MRKPRPYQRRPFGRSGPRGWQRVAIQRKLGEYGGGSSAHSSGQGQCRASGLVVRLLPGRRRAVLRLRSAVGPPNWGPPQRLRCRALLWHVCVSGAAKRGCKSASSSVLRGTSPPTPGYLRQPELVKRDSCHRPKPAGKCAVHCSFPLSVHRHWKPYQVAVADAIRRVGTCAFWHPQPRAQPLQTHKTQVQLTGPDFRCGIYLARYLGE